MRITYLIILMLALTVSAFSSEMTLSLDECQIVNDDQDNSLPSKLAIKFSIPQELIGQEVIYAEFLVPFALPDNSSDSLIELRFYPLLSAFPDGDIDYQTIESVTDSMGVGASLCITDDSTRFEVHITEFIREVAEGIRPNYGLMGEIDLLGDRNLTVPENMAETIRNQARVRIIYK